MTNPSKPSAPESPAKEQPGEQKWIPVSERLPKHGVDVMIYHVLGDRDRAEVPHAYDVGWLLKDGWYFPWDRGRDRQRPMFVTHWMPLPPPPPERP